ncbi:MAG TPA: DUF58 domain-containing protein [Thermoplasmata archaeon]
MRTSLASGLAAASLAFLLVGLAARSWQVVLLSLPPVLFLALGSLFPPPTPRVVAVRSLSRDRVQAGSDARVDLVVRNEGPALDLVEILDVLPPELAVVRGTNHAVIALERGGVVPLSYEVRSAVKGDFHLGPVRVRSLDPLALGAEDAVVPLDSRLVVAPAMEDLRRARLQPRRTRPWFGQVPSRRIGVGTDFWGIREYVPGDDVRRINWKASARFDRLFSNEYEGERSGDVVIVVDARRESFIGTEEDNPIEHAVRAALAIAEHVLASKNRVGLIVQRDVLDWVPPAFGRKQLYRILDHLTHVRPGGEWPFAHVAWVLSRFFPRNCLVVIISPLQDRSALSAIIALAARGTDVAIVSPSPLAIEWRLGDKRSELATAHRILTMERANLIAQLGRIAQVVDWDPTTPLALALRRMGTRPRPA